MLAGRIGVCVTFPTLTEATCVRGWPAVDYHRIYWEFIKDRRSREASQQGYVERHHILPRALGGEDDPANLIRLTPEDHFFAHLLLAKVYGGEMWAPVAFMVGGDRRFYKPVKSRKAHGWVVRALAEAKKGKGAYQFDHTIYDLVHRDGREWSGTQFAMAADLGMSRPLANMLVKGRVKTACGWWRKGERPKFRGADFSGSGHPMYRAEVIEFRHVDGRRFTGTQYELHLTHGIAKSMVCRLARGQFRCAKGWYVEGKPPAKVGRGARWKLAV